MNTLYAYINTVTRMNTHTYIIHTYITHTHYIRAYNFGLTIKKQGQDIVKEV
jgi:hypothetical protein